MLDFLWTWIPNIKEDGPKMLDFLWTRILNIEEDGATSLDFLWTLIANIKEDGATPTLGPLDSSHLRHAWTGKFTFLLM